MYVKNAPAIVTAGAFFCYIQSLVFYAVLSCLPHTFCVKTVKIAQISQTTTQKVYNLAAMFYTLKQKICL